MAAIFLAAGLWAHYEAGLVAIPAFFAIGVLWVRYPTQRRAWMVGLGGALIVGGTMLALFYLPYVLHAQFGATYTYLVDRRIAGEGFPVNNVADLWLRLTTYSSSYYGLTLITLMLAGLLALYRRVLGRWGTWVAGAALLILMALTFYNPSWATVAGHDLWVLLAALALLPAWFMPRTAPKRGCCGFGMARLLVIMLGFTSKPRTHVYTFFAPWALLVGMVVQRLTTSFSTRFAARNHGSTHRLVWMGATVGIMAALIFGGYVYQIFVYTRVEVLRTWNVNWPWGYWRSYAVLDNDALFGFPLTNGWKVVGQLYANGTLRGDYSTNEVEYWAPIWYTHGRMRCDDRAQNFFQIESFQSDPAGYRLALQTQLTTKEFQPWANVTIHGEPRMLIRQRGSQAASPQNFALEQYAAAFDAAATPDLPLGYPVVEPPIEHPLDVNFGNLIRLEGFDVEAPMPLEPGSQILLTLYWRPLQAIDASYKVFNQSYYGDGVMVAQQDGYPICGGRGTWLWEPGVQVADVHLLTILPGAPDGLYPLYTGLYIEETLDRLNVIDAEGQPVTDRAHLTDIRVGDE